MDRRHLIAVALLSIIVYANTLGNGFVIDDHDVIDNNPKLRDFGNAHRVFTSSYFGLAAGDVKGLDQMYYRPLSFFSFMLDYKLWGLNPWNAQARANLEIVKSKM